MKVLITDKINESAGKIVEPAAGVDFLPTMPEDELIKIIPQYDALMVRSQTKVTAKIIEAGKNLKIIGRAGVGVDNIDVDSATQRGIIVVNSPDGNTIAAAEHTIALMFAVARNIVPAAVSTKEGRWDRAKFTGCELFGKTLGIIGFGKIGTHVAEVALALGMKVVVSDPYASKDVVEKMGAEYVKSLDNFWGLCDFITVHVPKNNETVNLINKSTINKMKKGVRLINCARGGIINEKDLAEAVKSGHVAGAAIDVFESEPLATDSPLLGVPGITLTPHLGASTVEAQIGVSVDVAQGIVTALNGEPVSTAVNMAPVSAQTMKVIKPYLDLAERLGCTACSLADGGISEIKIKYNGGIADVDTKMITIAVVKGILNPILEDKVNYVNAPSLAKERNIKVKEVKDKSVENFANLITVSVVANGKTQTVQGALFGDEGRIVTINSYRVDVDPHARILICPHINRPGIIGTIGSLLGYANINISGMQVGKTEIEGTSMMVLTIDNEIPDSVMQQIINMNGIFDVKLVNYNVVK